MSEAAEDLSVMNARLIESRARLGLDPSGKGRILLHSAPQPGVRCSRVDAPPSVADALGALPTPGRYTCSAKLANGARCRAEIAFPGVCAACYAAGETAERAAETRQRLLRIPGEYRDATWDGLEAGLESRVGGPRVLCDIDRVRRIRAQLSALPEGARVVIVGPPAGVGKSTLAAAWLRAEIERGVTNAWWVSADDIDSDAVADDQSVVPRDAFRRGASVVMDDLGGEVAGAPLGSGLLAQRIAAASKAIAARTAKKFGRTVITTSVDETKFGETYGGRISRRVFEGAVVIELLEARE